MYGVVEGFYGKPYSAGMRESIFRLLSGPCDPVYLYAPKDDPYHRRLWREPCPPEAWMEVDRAIRAARGHDVRFYFGLSPWKFQDSEHGMARERFLTAAGSGASGLCLLFDDIPQEASGSLAERQLSFAEKALSGIDLPVMLCPTVYCREFLRGRPGASQYLERWRACANPDWDVLWTGNDVISRELDGLDEAATLLGRAPVIWDNLLADDYCIRRVFLGSLAGRAPEGVSLLLNPSCIFPVALHGVMELAGLFTGSLSWPHELGPRLRGWEILRDFHFTPWETTDEGARVLCMLRAALSGKDPADSLEWLNNSLSAMEEMADSVTEITGGWDLYPLVRDTIRVMSIWRRALAGGEPSSRAFSLDYLMRRRLPYENPLAASAAHPLEEWV